jgi:hypothetical protein
LPRHEKRAGIGFMATEKTDQEILAQYGIVFDSRPDARLSQFGGLSPILEFLKKGKIRSRLEELFGEKRARCNAPTKIGERRQLKTDHFQRPEWVRRDRYVKLARSRPT